MRAHIAFLLASALTMHAADGPPLLTSLASQLRALRALHLDANSRAACPKNTKPLVGLAQELIHRRLGEPDFVDLQERSWSYFFTAPLSLDLRGGGFPQLNFTFNSANEVSSVSCYYAR